MTWNELMREIVNLDAGVREGQVFVWTPEFDNPDKGSYRPLVSYLGVEDIGGFAGTRAPLLVVPAQPTHTEE